MPTVTFKNAAGTTEYKDVDSGAGTAGDPYIDRNRTITGAALTALQLLDDVVYTDDGSFSVVVDKVAAVGALHDDTAPDYLDEGDIGAIRQSIRRELYVQLRDAAGNERGLNIDASGNITVNLSAADNAVLDAIQAAVETLDNAIAGSEMQVDVVTSALPTGAATSANQSTANTSLSNIETDTGNIDTSLNNIEAGYAVDATALGSGVLIQGDDGTDRKNINVDPTTGDVQVDVTNTVTVDGSGVTQPVSGTVTANLSATDNAVLDSIDTAVNGTVTVGSHDVTNAGTFATQATLQTGSNVVGKVNLTDGTDDATIRDVTGAKALDVSIVDASGNQITSFGGSGGTAETDDAAFTAGSGSGTPIMGFASSDVVDSGDVGVVGMDTNRNLKVSIEADNVGIGGGTQYTEDDAAAANPTGNMMIGVRDDALSGQTSTDGDNVAMRATDKGELYVKHTDTLTVDGSGVTQPVSGTVTANLSVTDNAVLDNIETNTDFGAVTGGGVEATALRVTLANDSTGVVSVDDNGGSLTVDNADITTLAGAVAGTEMQVDVVAPLPAGTNAIGKLAANSGVDIGDVDVTSVPGALQGPGNPTVDSFSSAVVDLAASTTNQSLVAAPGASKQIWVFGLFMMADTAAGTVTLQDEDDTALSGTMAVSDEGGWVLPMSGNFAMPWIKVATNKALEADTGACTVDGILTYAIVSV